MDGIRLDQLSEIEYLIKRINSSVLDIFAKAKSNLDERDWLKPLKDKYGNEKEIPWKERRKLLFKEIMKEVKANTSDVLREALLNVFAEWIYAKRLLFSFLQITEKDLDAYLEALIKLHQRGVYPDDFIIWNPTHGSLRKDMISKFLTFNDDKEELFLKAMDTGYYLSRVLGNISPLVLLIVLLPTIDHKNKMLYLQEGETALKLFMIKDYWYSFIEKRELPDIEHWEFWKEFINEIKEETH